MHLFIIAPLLSCLMFTVISENSCLACEAPTESCEPTAKRLRVRPLSSTSSPSFSRHSEVDILPEELLIIIFDQLNFRDLGAVQLVCRQWHRLGGDEILSIARHIHRKPLSEVLWKLETIKEGPVRLNQEITALVSNQATGEKFFKSPDAIRKLLLAPKAVEYVLQTPSLIPLLFKSDVTASEIHHTLDRKTLDEDQQSALKTFVKSGSNLYSTINLYSEECINFAKDFAPHYKAWYLLYLFASPQSEEPMHEWFRSIYAHITSEDAYEDYSEDQALLIPKSLVYFSDLPYNFTQALGVYCHERSKQSVEESLKNLWLKFAEKFLLKCISQEEIEDQLNLGVVLQDQGKLEEAEVYLRKAANKGDIISQGYLAALLEDQRQFEEAEFFYRQAASQGTTEEKFNLGVLLYKRGKLEEGKALIRKAADKGYLPAESDLGQLLCSQQKFEEAEVYLRKAADKGDTDAQSRLGQLLYGQKKFEEAEVYLRKAASNGEAITQYKLAVLLEERGKLDEAVFLLHDAARKEYVLAQYSLGIYSEQQGNVENAIANYEKAAKKNYKLAYVRLASLYETHPELFQRLSPELIIKISQLSKQIKARFGASSKGTGL